LLYSIDQGPQECKIIQQCLRERLPFPQAIQNAPQLQMGLELFFDAFLDLDGDRPPGWTTSPIPWAVVKDYAKAYNITGEQRDDLVFFVRRMDRAYLGHLEKKAKKK